MNAILKTIIIVAVIGAVGAMINLVIPTALSSNVNSSVIYFLSSMNVLQFLFHMDVFFQCFQIVINFIYGVMIFFILKWVLHLVSN